MIEIRLLTEQDEQALALPNEAFSLFGRLQVRYDETGWQAKEERFAPEDVSQQTFPEEHYVMADVLKQGFAVGAFDGKLSVGLWDFTDDWLEDMVSGGFKSRRRLSRTRYLPNRPLHFAQRPLKKRL